MQPRSLSSYVCLVGIDIAALVGLRPQPAALVRDLSSPHAWVQSAGADAAAATLGEATLWLAAAWLALGLLAGALASAPGHIGRRAALLTRALLPDVLYRMTVGATSAGLVLAPVAGVGAFAAGGVAHASGSAAAQGPSIPAPAWPTSAPDSAAPVAIHHPPPPKASAQAGVVTVRPGDSLWRIAAARLVPTASDKAITAGWRRIYQANRAVIGPDPGLIRPGQHLHVDGTVRP